MIDGLINLIGALRDRTHVDHLNDSMIFLIDNICLNYLIDRIDD